MVEPIEQLRNHLIESCEYYAEKSSKGCVAAPTVILGVLRGVLDRVNKLFPRKPIPIVIKKKIVLVKKASKK
jgi:hypothetical protein